MHNGALVMDDFPDNQQNIKRSDIKKLVLRNSALFALWTTDFDCGEETEWWYCIRDIPVSLELLSSKQRYRVKKGLSNFNIRLTPPHDKPLIIRRLYNIRQAVLASYPAKYRPRIDFESFSAAIYNDDDDYWSCFDVETGKLMGYATCHSQANVVYMVTVVTHPEAHKREINAGLAYTICHHYINELGYAYVCDGHRNIRHETDYQNYLVRVLGFRFAYCRLHILYHPLLSPFVKLLRLVPMKVVAIFSNNKYLYNVYCLLKLERIARTFR